jgi:hypothetical protein
MEMRELTRAELELISGGEIVTVTYDEPGTDQNDVPPDYEPPPNGSGNHGGDGGGSGSGSGSGSGMSQHDQLEVAQHALETIANFLEDMIGAGLIPASMPIVLPNGTHTTAGQLSQTLNAVARGLAMGQITTASDMTNAIKDALSFLVGEAASSAIAASTGSAIIGMFAGAGYGLAIGAVGDAYLNTMRMMRDMGREILNNGNHNAYSSSEVNNLATLFTALGGDAGQINYPH